MTQRIDLNPAQLTREACAHAAACYAVSEFTRFDSWLSHERELAKELTSDPAFVGALDAAIALVVARWRTHPGMTAYAAARGPGGLCALVGAIAGEWLGGQQTISQIAGGF